MATEPRNEDDPVFLTNESRTLRGVRRLLQVNRPAAGSEWSAQVPGGRMWRPLGGGATFATSAAVANRVLGLHIVVQGQEVYINANAQAIVAGANQPVVYMQSPGPEVSGQFAGRAFVPILPMWLIPGDIVGSLTVAMDAADQYSAVNVLIEEAFYDPVLLQELYYDKARISDAMMAAMRG